MSLSTSQPDALFIDINNNGIADPGETLAGAGTFDNAGGAGALSALLVAAASTGGPGGAAVGAADPFTGTVWYVDNSAAAGGDGSSAHPFNSLAAASGASGPDVAGDIIYVSSATADAVQTWFTISITYTAD